MTELEKQTLADGFRVLLLGCMVDPGQDAIQVRVQLFDGGRPGHALELEERYWRGDDNALRGVRRLVADVVDPPHVTVAYGRGWRQFIDEFLTESRDDLRILDLTATARALADLAPGAGDNGLAAAYGIAQVVAVDAAISPFYEDLFWAVLALAGERGLDWPQLISLPEETRSQPHFTDYEFGAAALANVPSAPGVYIMRDAKLSTLYVGKSADLASRLGSYFRGTARLPAKLERIRDQISSFEVELCGSELEALLLENRLIGELSPSINVQRSIVPGSSRYRPKAGAVVIALPSTVKRRTELFFFGSRDHALQLRVLTERPPTAVLAGLVLYFCEDRNSFRSHPHLTNWGGDGAEICYRYWSRCRNSLNWVELGLNKPAEEAVALLKQTVRTAARGDTPAEFRLT